MDDGVNKAVEITKDEIIVDDLPKVKQSLKDKYGYETHHRAKESFQQAWEWIRHPLKNKKDVGIIILMAIGLALTMLGIVALLALVKHDPNVYSGNIADEDILRTGIIEVFRNNMLVLLFHTAVCFAAFLGSFVILEQAKSLTNKHEINFHNWVSKGAGVFIILATVFSVTKQVWITSSSATELASLYGLTVYQMIISILPHAIIELSGIFLPLVSLYYVSRIKKQPELLYATAIASFTYGAIIILIAATIERFIWPEMILLLINR